MCHTDGIAKDLVLEDLQCRSVCVCTITSTICSIHLQLLNPKSVFLETALGEATLCFLYTMGPFNRNLSVAH